MYLRRTLQEILKSYWHNGKRAPVYYFRDKDKREIDLLLVQDNKIYPIEFKKTASPKKDAIQNFKALQTLKVPIGRGSVICLCDTLLPITKEIDAFPAYAL